MRRAPLYALPAALTLTLLAAGCAGQSPPGAPHTATRSRWAFGKLSGYVWNGDVTSIQASWTVPFIEKSSPPGAAGTWIGAQTAFGNTPFIQVGINEAKDSSSTAPASTSYYAFWSDKAHHFRAIPLFPVAPFGEVTARMALAHRRWTITISEVDSEERAQFTTPEEGSASFGLALWMQEDITNLATGKPQPYPALYQVGFRQLVVNGKAPAYDELHSQWMTASGANFAPTALSGDSFAIEPATLSENGADYLRMANQTNRLADGFYKEVEDITAETAPPQLAASRATFATALSRFIVELTSTTWPRSARSAVRALARRNRALLVAIRSPLGANAHSALTWKRRVVAAEQPIGQAVLLARRALDVPQVSLPEDEQTSRG